MTPRVTLKKLGLEESYADKLEQFISLFEKWNRSINLSAASSIHEITEHLVDSLHVIPYLADRGRVLDVGSGGGFPVVLVAICSPNTELVSLEPVHKKHAFLRTAARELKLPNLEARAQRLEDHDVHDYDAAMSRATFDIVEWLARGREYVCPTGIVLGFEAIPRDDIPAGVVRHPYSLAGKQRAILVAPPPPAA